MNQGKSLVELAQELTRRATAKTDLIVDTRRITIEPEHAHLSLEGHGDPYPLTKNAHRQLGEWSDIPVKYYKKMLADSPALLAGNVNHWLHHTEKPVERMIRTLDGQARAFLSNKYRRIDNEHVADAALPILLESDEIEVVSCDVTENRLYIKALYPRIEGEVKRGDLVQAGVMISNSEVGCGRLLVSPLVYRLECTNGMIADVAGEYSMSKYHVGRQVGGDATSYEIYRDETIQADDAALLMKLQDTVRATANPAVFQTLLAQMQAAAQGDTIQAPPKAVEVLGKTFGLNEEEKGGVLENLIRDRDYSQWGALNAVTQLANTQASYERSTELEAIGGRILTLPRNQWQRIAQAKKAA